METIPVPKPKSSIYDPKQKTEESLKGYATESRRETIKSESQNNGMDQNSISEIRSTRKYDTQVDKKIRKQPTIDLNSNSKQQIRDTGINSVPTHANFKNNFMSLEHPTSLTEAPPVLAKVQKDMVQGLEKLKFLDREDKEELKDFIRKEINGLRLDFIKELELQKVEFRNMLREFKSSNSK